MNPHAWLDLTLDPGWVVRDDALSSMNPLDFPGYDPDHEPILSVSGACGGHAIEAIAFDFDVLGGSMGVVVGETVARAFERALARRAAVLALTASGGARMQEGMPALVQMAKTVTARTGHRKAGLPFIAYLRNPTTGGVYASFGSLADIVWAEPDATVGFAGPRVAQTVTGKPLPPGSHSAAFAERYGLIDAIVPVNELKPRLRIALDVLLGRDAPSAAPEPPEPKRSADLNAWAEVELARHPLRPTGAGFARRVCSDLSQINGDRTGFNEEGMLCGFARISGVRAAVIAIDRTHPMPPGFRKAQRLMSIAGGLKLPLVTFIDTPGADPSSESEAMGIARSIAQTFHDVLEYPAPTVAVVTGEGGSGGALALAACDQILICEHAVFSVIGPEAAASILKRDDPQATANDLRLTSHDLRAFGIADRIVAEPYPGAHADPDSAADAIARGIARALVAADPRVRHRRWREAGNGYLKQ
jgi:acetyl-CoA carboxylase carboxyl transferase subunit beta